MKKIRDFKPKKAEEFVEIHKTEMEIQKTMQKLLMDITHLTGLLTTLFKEYEQYIIKIMEEKNDTRFTP